MKSTRKLRELLVSSLSALPTSLHILHICSERYYKGIQEDSNLCVKLTGNWETLVGDQDTFLHVLEYENYGGYDKATQLVRTSKAR